MIKSSHLSTKETISSVLGSDYTEPANDEEKQLRNGGIVQDVDRMYAEVDDEDESDSAADGYSSDAESEKGNSQVTFSPFCGKVTRKQELPTPLFAGKTLPWSRDKDFERIVVVFADARQKVEDPIGRYFTESNLYRVWSLMTLPLTLPIDLTYAITKR
jgi:hypothetical protein